VNLSCCGDNLWRFEVVRDEGEWWLEVEGGGYGG